MVYGELGEFPLELQAKTRMLNFWFKLVNINCKHKFSNIMYTFLYDMYHAGIYKSPFLSSVETILNEIGLSGMWINQFNLNVSNQRFRSEVKKKFKGPICSKLEVRDELKGNLLQLQNV